MPTPWRQRPPNDRGYLIKPRFSYAGVSGIKYHVLSILNSRRQPVILYTRYMLLNVRVDVRIFKLVQNLFNFKGPSDVREHNFFLVAAGGINDYIPGISEPTLQHRVAHLHLLNFFVIPAARAGGHPPALRDPPPVRERERVGNR